MIALRLIKDGVVILKWTFINVAENRERYTITDLLKDISANKYPALNIVTEECRNFESVLFYLFLVLW